MAVVQSRSSVGALVVLACIGCSLPRAVLGPAGDSGSEPRDAAMSTLDAGLDEDAFVVPVDAWTPDDVGPLPGDGGFDASVTPIDAGRDAFVPPVDAGRDAFTPPVCGDGHVDAGELCDDHNTNDGDGCAADCGYEHLHTVTSGPGLARAIPDDRYDGTLASMTCVDLAVPAWPLDAVTSVQVTVAMSHSWVGDLTMKLVGPTGTVITLMSRPGNNEPADDGTTGNGDGSNLATGSPITFDAGAMTSSELMGMPLRDNETVCRDDPTCSFAPSHGAAAPGDFGTFTGMPASGTWRFCVGDGANNDTGSIDAVTLRVGV